MSNYYYRKLTFLLLVIRLRLYKYNLKIIFRAIFISKRLKEDLPYAVFFAIIFIRLDKFN